MIPLQFYYFYVKYFKSSIGSAQSVIKFSRWRTAYHNWL